MNKTSKSNIQFNYLDESATDIQNEVADRARISARGRAAQAPNLNSGFFAQMDGAVNTMEKLKVKPIRGSMNARTSSGLPPFAREGEQPVIKSITGVPRSPERRSTGRIPFGTEADYAASFANGIGPNFFG